jgi:hypothetical protein
MHVAANFRPCWPHAQINCPISGPLLSPYCPPFPPLLANICKYYNTGDIIMAEPSSVGHNKRIKVFILSKDEKFTL